MNILMVLDSTFPHDWRVQKEALALIDAGYKVSVLCHYESNVPRIENKDGIDILRFIKKKRGVFSFLNKVIFYMVFIDVIFYFQLRYCLKNYRIDFVHIHDLPLTKTTVYAGKRKRIKLVLDLHENYPEAIQVWSNNFKDKSLKNVLLRRVQAYSRWKRYERYCLNNVDLVITVIEEMKQYLLKCHFGVNEQKVTIVSNTESLMFTRKEKNQDILSKYSQDFYVLYIGGLGWHRGVDTLIHSVKYLNENIKVLIVGGGPVSFTQYMESEIEKLGDSRRVTWLGSQPNFNGSSYIAASSVGVIPHHSNQHCDNTIPHKLFHFMLEKKPLLVSSSTSLQRVVTETKSGEIFESSNEKALAQKLNDLYLNESLRVQYGENGYHVATTGKYTWEHDKQQLIDAYEKI